MNGDPFDDLLVSSGGEDPLVQVYYGRDDVTLALTPFTTADETFIIHDQPNGAAANAAGVGDVNGDGLDDLAVVDATLDRVSIVYGKATGIAGVMDREPFDLLHEFSGSDGFGYSVAGVGSNILIGRDWGNEAYLYDGETFELLHTFQGPTGNPYPSFGRSLAAVGSNILIGTGDAGGAVYLYDGETYELLHTFEDPDGNPDANFGCVCCRGGIRHPDRDEYGVRLPVRREYL